MGADENRSLVPASEAAVAAASGTGSELTWRGPELVELSERFSLGVFTGMLVFVELAALAALALLPLRQSVHHVGSSIVGLAAGGLIVPAVPLVVWQRRRVYLAARRHPRLELVPVAFSALLVTTVFPLHSQLWWPSCALLMLVATVAPLSRMAGYCLLVLGCNLLAHLLAGDLASTPVVSILGLWIGYPFWSCTVAAIGGQMSGQLLRRNVELAAARPSARRVAVTVNDEQDGATPSIAVAADVPATTAETSAPQPVPAPQPSGSLSRLTNRQLQVVLLLSEGLRYREIAACLSIAERQVQRHVAEAVKRAGVRTGSALVALAATEGLVDLSGAHPNREFA